MARGATTVIGRPPARAPAAHPRGGGRTRRTASTPAGPTPTSSARGAPAAWSTIPERERAPEHQHVLRLLVLLGEVVAGDPFGGGGTRPGPFRPPPAPAQAADVRGVERERLAHPPLEHVDQRVRGATPPPPCRLGASGPSGRDVGDGDRRASALAAAHGVRREGRSGHVALRTSSRTQAMRRCAGPSFEYVTVCTTSPRTPGTVPTTLSASGQVHVGVQRHRGRQRAAPRRRGRPAGR